MYGVKMFVCDTLRKSLFVFDRGEKVMLNVGRKKSLVRKKNPTLPPGIKWSAPYEIMTYI